MSRGKMAVPQRLSRKESQQQTRARLLQAAAQVFSRRGFYAASIDDVAAEAGFSKGAVYSNFASKEDLFLALVEQRFESDARDFENIGHFLDYHPEPGEVSEYTQAIAADRTWNLLVIEFFLYAVRDETLRQKMSSHLRKLHDQMTARLRETLAAQGRTPAIPLEQLPMVISALGVGLSIMYYVAPETFPNQVYEHTLEQILR
jgi:AcrR family transcriptional regulator